MSSPPSGFSPALDHIGIAVRDLQAAAAAWRALLQVDLERVEEVASEGVRVGYLPLPGCATLELLEPLAEDTPVGRFLSTRGPGIHHLSFRVPSCADALRAAEQAGIRPLPPAPRPGSGGTLVAFFHPRDTGGVLIELCERPRGAGPGSE